MVPERFRQGLFALTVIFLLASIVPPAASAGNTKPTAVIDVAESRTNFGRSVLFDGSVSFDPDPEDTLSHSWVHFGEVVGTNESIDFAFPIETNGCLELTVTDDHGASDSELACIQVGHFLDVKITKTKALFAATERARFFIEVRTLDGDPVPNPSFNFEIIYNSGFGALESLPECMRHHKVRSEADSNGNAFMTVPSAFLGRCGGTISLVEFPTAHTVRYRAEVTAWSDEFVGMAATNYQHTTTGREFA